jgi:hypothetical protein
MMRRVVGNWKVLAVVAVIATTLFTGCSDAEPEVRIVTQTAIPPAGVLLPYPEEGKQYRMTEVCEALTRHGYEVRATLRHTFGADVFEPLLEEVPGLVRKPLENYLSDGLSAEFEIQSLCQALADK